MLRNCRGLPIRDLLVLLKPPRRLMGVRELPGILKSVGSCLRSRCSEGQGKAGHVCEDAAERYKKNKPKTTAPCFPKYEIRNAKVKPHRKFMHQGQSRRKSAGRRTECVVLLKRVRRILGVVRMKMVMTQVQKGPLPGRGCRSV